MTAAYESSFRDDLVWTISYFKSKIRCWNLIAWFCAFYASSL